MYDCDKGFILSERGPVGATCVGGIWRPVELPQCLPGLHPRLRWNRRKRSLQMKHHRSQYIQRNYRQLQRKLHELLADETNIRSKRSISVKPHHHHRQIYKKQSSTNRRRWGAIAPALLRLKRSSNIDQQYVRTVGNAMHREQRNGNVDPHEAAYMKYYERIKQKHRNYISNLLRAHHNNASRNMDRPLVHTGPSMNRILHNIANENELYRNDDLQHDQDDTLAANAVFHELNALASVPIPLPNINENMKKVMHHSQPFVNNTYVGHSWNRNKNTVPAVSRPGLKNSTIDFMAQLASQLQRKKRSADEDLRDEIDQSETNKKARAREPCEVSVRFVYHEKNHMLTAFYLFFSIFQPILIEPFIRIDIVREGKDPSNEYSAGTIVRATCAKEYRLNLQNPNGTAKCVRGRWKPLKPSCTLIPCSVPSTEHGSYSAITIDPQDEKASTSPLNAFDEVQDGEVVEFSCDEGYNVQGPTQLKCHESSWAVAGLPECVPAPCSLPVINNAVYQVC